jgi:hypothetical protein
MKKYNAFFATLALGLMIFLPAMVFSAKIIGIDIQSKWGASWKFPVLGLDNRGTNGEGVKDYRYLHTMSDGDVLVIGTHSNPDVFGSGTQLVNWADFWQHFKVDNPPKLGAVIICGCMEGVTDQDLENIRSAFNAGAVFSPRGTYGLPHLISTETIITDLKNGKSIDVIMQEVKSTHFVKTDSDVQPGWNLDRISASRVTAPGTQNGFSSSNPPVYTQDGGIYIWINKFGDGGRIHMGSMSTFNASKRYVDEWLAGTSTEYLEKQMLYEGRSFNSTGDAGSFICGQITNRRYQNVLGWGRIELGDLNGKSYLIDGLGCSIP